MRILITNDDGINSKLLKILANALKNYADEILVVAPFVEMSATSHKLTLREGMEVLKYPDIIEGIPSYSVNGTPADCVKIGLNLLEFKPDYIFSGINNGYNVGNDILYSGTVSAAMEAALCGYKGIAISFQKDDIKATIHLENVLDYIFESEILKDAEVLNVNIPHESKDIRITHQGVFPFETKYVEKEKNIYYADAKCIGLEVEYTIYSDVYNVYNGYTSITPLTVNRCNNKIFEKYKHISNK